MRKPLLTVALAALVAMPVAHANAAAGHEARTIGTTCTHGYSPCLVYHGGKDYDCAGGGGNGPFYTKPGVVYHVTGSDPYRLDTNHNHRGCE